VRREGETYCALQEKTSGPEALVGFCCERRRREKEFQDSLLERVSKCLSIKERREGYGNQIKQSAQGKMRVFQEKALFSIGRNRK